MDPFTIAAIGAPILGGLIGANQAQGSVDSANNARNAALAQYAGLQLPSIEEQQLLMQQYVNAGLFNPQLESTINNGSSAFEGIALDPQLRQKQMEALNQMNQVALEGVTPADRAIQEMVRRNSASEAEAKNQQILQNMQARGMGGSGNELIARLQASQQGADRMAQQGLQEQANKQNARMQAMEQYGNMAGQVRTQDYGEQANLANARDAINKMNTANAQQVQQRNVGSQNQAQQYNLGNQQSISNNNVNLQNQQQQYNKGLIQQNYNNQLQKAQGMAGQYNNQASAYQNQAANTAGMWSGIGQGAGTLMGGFAAKTQAPATQMANQNVMNKIPVWNSTTGRYE